MDHLRSFLVWTFLNFLAHLKEFPQINIFGWIANVFWNTSCIKSRYFLYWILKWHKKLHYYLFALFCLFLDMHCPKGGGVGPQISASAENIKRPMNAFMVSKNVHKTREINYNFLFLKISCNQLKNYFLRYGLEGKDEKWLKKIQRCIIQKFLNVWVPNGKFWPRSKKGHLLMRLKD